MRLSIIIPLLCLSALVGCARSQPVSEGLPRLSIVVGGAPLEVEVASNDRERSQGLSGRDSLDEGKGMLFTFEQPGNYEFWMYQMRFPLDFLWIADDRVVGLAEKVPFPTPASPVPELIRPPSPVTEVLEVPAGWVERHRIIIGAAVERAP